MRRTWRTLAGAAAVALCLQVGAGRAQADFSDTWTDQYEGLLKKYVRPGSLSGVSSALVDYQGLREDPQLMIVRKGLARLPSFSGLPGPARLALWVNIYNFLVLDRVARSPGLKTLLDLNNPGRSVWFQPAGTVAEQVYSLHQIEREVLWKQFKEPRVHFVLTKGAVGSPDLRTEAYRAVRLEEQMRDQAMNFLGNPKKGSRIQAEPEPPILFLAEFFRWFRRDFGGGPKRWLVGRGLLPEKARTFNRAYLSFDFRLNAQPGRN